MKSPDAEVSEVLPHHLCRKCYAQDFIFSDGEQPLKQFQVNQTIRSARQSAAQFNKRVFANEAAAKQALAQTHSLFGRP